MVWKVGLVGCGLISRCHLEGWKRVPSAQVVAVCDINEERARERAEQYQISKVYTDAMTMFDNEDLDIADITPWLETHRDLSVAAAERGLHVLCQKPLAPTRAEAEDIIRACRKNNVTLMVHQNNRWQPWVRETKAAIEQGRLGQVFYVSMVHRYPFAITIRGEKESGMQKIQPFLTPYPRLVLLEMAIHYIDTMRFLLGDPRSVYAVSRHISPLVKGEDMVTAVFDFGAALATVEVSWCTVELERAYYAARVEGTGGTVHYGGGSEMTIATVDGQKESHKYEIQDYWFRTFGDVQNHFVTCLEKGVEPETGGRDNLRTLELVWAGYESIETGQVVTLAPTVT